MRFGVQSAPDGIHRQAIGKDGRMNAPARARWHLFLPAASVIAILLLVGGIFYAYRGEAETPNARRNRLPKVEWSNEKPETLRLPKSVVDGMKIQLTPVIAAPPPPSLRLLGTLFIDTDRLVHIHARFPGEVVEIGEIVPEGSSEKPRPVRFGDRVKKGQLLAVVWCRDIGDMKSNLVDALCKLTIDEQTLHRLKNLAGSVVETRRIAEAERQYESDVIEVDRTTRTLRSWRLSEEEIAKVKDEADRVRKAETAAAREIDRTWSQTEIHAPFDGVLLEKNVAVGDIIDSSLDIFKVGDLSRLRVLVNAYEEELPLLQAMPQDKRDWVIRLVGDPRERDIRARFDLIGDVIDPTQHTALVMGWLDNPAGEFKIGQFVTATVQLDPNPDEVSVPVNAIIEEPTGAVLFVAADKDATAVTRRRVAFIRRARDVAYIRSKPKPEEAKRGLVPLDVNELVVSRGVIELSGALVSLTQTNNVLRGAAANPDDNEPE